MHQNSKLPYFMHGTKRHGMIYKKYFNFIRDVCLNCGGNPSPGEIQIAFDGKYGTKSNNVFMVEKHEIFALFIITLITFYLYLTVYRHLFNYS
jgi:hypothetical protein